MELEPVIGEAELHVGLRKQQFLRKSHLGLEGYFCFSLSLAPLLSVSGAIAISLFASPTATSQVTFVHSNLTCNRK